MTRQQAADRLLRLVKIRDAKDACEMGARALLNLPWLIAYGFFLGFLIGVLVTAVIHG